MVQTHLRDVHLWRVETEDRLTLLHQVEAITRDESNILRVCLQQLLLARATNEELFLLIDLRDERLYLSLLFPAFTHFRECLIADSCRYDHYDKCRKEAVQGGPETSLRGIAKISCLQGAHLAHLTAVNGVVTQFFFDTKKLIVLRHTVRTAE